MGTEKRTYEGSCHCGKIRFEATSDLAQVIDCNCSICRRVGALRTFVPLADFKLKAGSDDVVDYQFGKKHLHHQFCPGCGIHPFARGSKGETQMVAVNVRCLEGVDLGALKITPFDGKSR